MNLFYFHFISLIKSVFDLGGKFLSSKTAGCGPVWWPQRGSSLNRSLKLKTLPFSFHLIHWLMYKNSGGPSVDLLRENKEIPNYAGFFFIKTIVLRAQMDFLDNF